MRNVGEVVKGSLPKGANMGWNRIIVVMDSLIRGKIFSSRGRGEESISNWPPLHNFAITNHFFNFF